MPYYCTVPRCTSMAGKAKNVSFHQFPRDEELAKLWNKILKRGKPYTKYSKVCSLHFTPEDYTITSVGKNKGQWRTLRKDAIPSQNLPSESPTPYQRKQWSSWTRDPSSNIMDPTIHQQVAQAIYMQTMLAMQAAGATEMPTLNHGNGLPPVSTEAFAHTSATTDSDILKGKQTNTHTKSNSYKCTECSKCFKDPDVFVLHKRSHIKNEKTEKENFNLNLTLQANPILANLLKTNSENSNIFDNNFSVESLLMTALAANMEGYMRNFTSMIKGDERGHLDHDRGNLDHDRGNLDHDRDDLDHDRDDLDHDMGHSGHETSLHNGEERGVLDHDTGHSGHETSLHNGEEGGVLDHEKDHIDHGNRDHQRNHGRRGFIQDCQSTSQSALGLNLQNDRGVMNHGGSDMDNDRGLMNHDSNVFNDRIELYRNNTYGNDRRVRYYENENNESSSDSDTMDDDRSEKGDDPLVDDDSGMADHGRAMIDHDRGVIDYDRHNGNGVTNDDDSQGFSDGPSCDKDLNESIDSNQLVIDETA